MRALFAAREAFYADAQKLENHPSPEPGAGDALSKRDAALLRDERVALSRDTVEAQREGAKTDREPRGATESARPEPTKAAPTELNTSETGRPAEDGAQRNGSADATKTLGIENRGGPYQDPSVDPTLPHKFLERRELRPYRRMDPVFSWKTAEARLREKQPAALGNKIKDAEIGQALIQRLALGDATVLQELGVSGAPHDFDPSTREWALVQLRDGFAIMAGSYDAVATPADVRTFAHNHPGPSKLQDHKGKVTDLPSNVDGVTFADILKNPTIAKDAAIVPSIKDIHAITDGAAHTIYTRYVHIGDGKITNPKDGANGARVQIHLADTRVALQKSRTHEYWYVTEMKVIDPNTPNEPLWSGTIYAIWRAPAESGSVEFVRPREFDQPEKWGWERVR